MMTAWGARITFGWELEGSSLDILTWYRPERIDAEPWRNLSRSNFDEKWGQLDQNHREQIYHMVRAAGRNWSHFIKLPTAPDFCAERLQQELLPQTWELTTHPPTYRILIKAVISSTRGSYRVFY
jgi:hypothetical protein